MQATFFFDIIACLPGMLTLEKITAVYFLKVFRYLQMPRLFDQIDLIVRKLKSRYFHRAILIVNVHMVFKTCFVMLILFHTLACVWIYIGGTEEGGWRDTFLTN